MGKEKDIISLIEDISTDLRAEVIISDLLKKGLLQDELIVKQVGLFKRKFGKDIAKIEKVDLKNNKSVLMINLNREGLYDVLPQALFHNPAKKPKPFKSVTEMVEEVKQRIKEEEASRKFFLPYEIEFFKQRLAVERQERKLLETVTFSMDDEKILSYWDLPNILDERQKGILFYLFPIIYKIRSDLYLIQETYSTILKEKITFVKAGVNPQKGETDLNFNTLGNSYLSQNSVIGKRDYHIYENLLINIGPLEADHLFDYLPSGKNRQIIEQLNSFFLPITTESEIRILVPQKEKEKSQWQLERNDKNANRLGYSLYM